MRARGLCRICRRGIQLAPGRSLSMCGRKRCEREAQRRDERAAREQAARERVAQ